MEIRRRTLGEEHSNTLGSMTALANVLKRRGQIEEAEKLQRRVLEIGQRVWGDEHPKTVKALQALATTLGTRGLVREQEEILRKVLDIRHRTLGDDHTETLKARLELAHILFHHEKHDDAVAEHWKALAGYSKLIDGGNASNLHFFEAGVLAAALGQQDRYKQICSAMDKRFGESQDPIDAHLTAWTCVLAPQALQDYAPAITLAQRAIEKKPNNQHYLVDLGAVLMRAGQYDNAKAMLEESHKLPYKYESSKVYKEYLLAMTEESRGDRNAAMRYLGAANQCAKKLLGDSHSLTWYHPVTFELFRKEVENMIAKKPIPVHP